MILVKTDCSHAYTRTHIDFNGLKKNQISYFRKMNAVHFQQCSRHTWIAQSTLKEQVPPMVARGDAGPHSSEPADRFCARFRGALLGDALLI